MNLSIRDVITLGVPYLIVIGALYQFGYWGAFQINVLEFISITDVGKLAIYPLVATLTVLLVGGVTGQLMTLPLFPPGGGADSPVGRFVIANERYFIVGLILASAYLGIYGPDPQKWFILAIIISPLSLPLTRLGKLIEVFPDRNVRHATLLLILVLPVMSFAHGRTNSYLIKNGWPDQFVDVVRSKLLMESDDKNRVAYLGYLGTVYVLRESKTGQIVFVKQRDDAPLFISPRVP